MDRRLHATIGRNLPLGGGRRDARTLPGTVPAGQARVRIPEADRQAKPRPPRQWRPAGPGACASGCPTTAIRAVGAVQQVFDASLELVDLGVDLVD